MEKCFNELYYSQTLTHWKKSTKRSINANEGKVYARCATSHLVPKNIIGAAMKETISNKVFLRRTMPQYSSLLNKLTVWYDLCLFYAPIALGKGKEAQKVPVFLLVCRAYLHDQTFMQKAGAFQSRSWARIAYCCSWYESAWENIPEIQTMPMTLALGAGLPNLNATQAHGLLILIVWPILIKD